MSTKSAIKLTVYKW